MNVPNLNPNRWAGFEWPRCTDCGEQKAFVCQVAQSPFKMFDNSPPGGTITFF